ncbi:MAG: NAD(P)H-binding protein [Chloroflexota bacterium]
MARRIFLTGGAGFVGGAVARGPQERRSGRAVVRDPSTPDALSDIGAELVQGDLGTVGAIRDAMTGCDVVVHVAGSYKVGTPDVAGRTLRAWPATFRCSSRRRRITPRCRPSHSVAASPACRPPTGPQPCDVIPTGSAPECRRARTTTT